MRQVLPGLRYNRGGGNVDISFQSPMAFGKGQSEVIWTPKWHGREATSGSLKRQRQTDAVEQLATLCHTLEPASVPYPVSTMLSTSTLQAHTSNFVPNQSAVSTFTFVEPQIR